jgi:hypothetical protein
LNFLSLLKRKFYYLLSPKINIDKQKNLSNYSLENLFSYYKTDKASFVNSKKSHGYTKYYLKYLNKFKNKKINILEIGSFSGASAAAFSKFFKNAKIFCIDVNIKNFKYYSKNIKVYGVDVSNKAHVLKFLKKININKNKIFFDIIIDDGSHKLKDMLCGLRLFFDHLKINGFYIIEDYKFPNYFSHLNDPSELTIDKLSKNILSKKLFKSQILEKKFQIKIFNEIKKIYKHKGSLKISNIVFFKKK